MARWLISLLCSVWLAVPALAVDAPRTDMFVAQTAGGNMFEIESSKLALDRSKNDKVRQFANQMVTDHTQAGAKFKQALTEAKLKAPPEAMDSKHKAVFEDLRKRDARDFDKAYIEAQYKAHTETVEMFEAYAQRGENARMKQFAAELLPKLREHLEHVKKLRSNTTMLR